MAQQHRGVIATVSAALCLLFAVAGCGMNSESGTAVSTPPTPSDHIPADFDTTFRWLPGDVLDLSAPEGTFVRAFVESFEIANAAQSTSWGYPGFSDAAPSNIDQMLTVYPSKVSDARPSVGTVFFSALRREDNAYGTRIVLCRYGYSSVHDGAGKSAWSSRVDTPRPVEIDFRQQAATPPVRVHGSQRTPGTDVFGAGSPPDTTSRRSTRHRPQTNSRAQRRFRPRCPLARRAVARVRGRRCRRVLDGRRAPTSERGATGVVASARAACRPDSRRCVPIA